ncbi:uncharacterized protein [Physcomitrium patens]|uniref:Uncharacterized protein n=1 Tax=Physcomitrium patens TaxID=3218 RepID=A0A2K1ICT0_PHYPA|nr:hypothetical protein PHYPA_030562 [Physcomitrium patens]
MICLQQVSVIVSTDLSAEIASPPVDHNMAPFWSLPIQTEATIDTEMAKFARNVISRIRAQSTFPLPSKGTLHGFVISSNLGAGAICGRAHRGTLLPELPNPASLRACMSRGSGAVLGLYKVTALCIL